MPAFFFFRHVQEHRVIDLRSDTVTRPSAAMLSAMMSAETGDDVYRDDPTVNALEAEAARMSGKAAALFFPTGTQANLVALLSHCERGDEYIVGQQAHNYKYEAGGAAVLGSIQPQPILAADDGTLPLDVVAAAELPAYAADHHRLLGPQHLRIGADEPARDGHVRQRRIIAPFDRHHLARCQLQLVRDLFHGEAHGLALRGQRRTGRGSLALRLRRLALRDFLPF